MPGRFILSLDCEGKWGIADHLAPEHHRSLSDARLREAYAAITGLLDDMAVPATFAFTECFLLPRERLLALPLDEIARRLPYTRDAVADVRDGSREGWSAPWARDMVGPRHEIASHGVTHTPWGEMDADQARFELSLLPRSDAFTFIFPRNQVAHLDLLAGAGCAGYRVAPHRTTRLASLASEFDLSALAEPDPSSAPLQAIPGGYFINWLSGLRRIVPTAITRRRARGILKDAVRTGGVAHFWTHPENIASAPATLANLRAIVEEAVTLRDRGELEIVTQADYCAARAASARLADRTPPAYIAAKERPEIA